VRMMRCILYRRVSTDMQAEEGFSLDAQKQRLLAYAESQGWTVVDDYCDDGYSAKNIDRPQMKRLIQDVKEKKFDIILVYRLDRFVRSVLDLHELLQLLDKHDVKFKSSTEIFDTTSATGRLFITLIATLAQWERETIAERVHMGMLKKVEQGQRNGAPAPYGYNLVDGKLLKNEEESKWVSYIFSRYGSVGSQTIAKELNSMGLRTKKGEIWSDFSVRYIMKNPIYSGAVRWNYETSSKGKRKKTGEETVTNFLQLDFEPLVTEDVFETTNKLLAKRSVQAFRSDNFYPFSGVAKCEKCGYGFTGASKTLKNGNIHRFYKCRGRISFGTCDAQAISEEVIESSFLDLLKLAETELDVGDSRDQKLNSIEIEKLLLNLARKKERTKELYIDGDITKDRYTSSIEEIKTEEARYHYMIQSVDDVRSTEKVKSFLRDIKNEWRILSYDKKKAAVHSIFESITIKIVEKAVPPNKKATIEIVDFKLI
jgi:site-specific DNA recombinase